MTIIKECFKNQAKLNKNAFIPFIVAGHPSIDKTEELIYVLEEEGSTIIEIGIPFSDPLADGPVIERAAQQSLSNGMTTKKVFELLTKVRQNTKIPIVILVYYNTILAYGSKNFINHCILTDVSGLVIPDLPYEERDELLPLLQNTNIALIPLVTPTSDERIKKITEDSKGFVYCVSSLGVTGIRSNFSQATGIFLDKVRSYTDLPLSIGFGISSPEDIIRFKSKVEGIIVGSALVKRIDETNCNFEEIRLFIKELVSAC